ncbi:MAG: universal stress protein, partial [Cyanobacteria bacterium P01_H01_bin.121]
AVQLGTEWHIPVHTQIRVAYSLAPAILEALHERHINLLIMGWKGKSNNPERIFGTAIDTLIRQAPCDLMLVKLSDKLTQQRQIYPSLTARLHFNRWLMPLAGGPNSRQALDLLPALTTISSTPEIQLCQIMPLQRSPRRRRDLLATSQTRLAQKLTCPITTFALQSADIAEAILGLAQRNACDVIVLGASRESLLQKALHGSIPEAIIRRYPGTVILMRTLDRASTNRTSADLSA